MQTLKPFLTYLNDPIWKSYLKTEFEKEYMLTLHKKLALDYQTKTIYPKADDLFSAFNSTPFEKVKVVILGQDPYHGAQQAHGLCFSVQPGVKVPPSLSNIYKELSSDLGFEIPNHGHLQSWANNGVLMLNSLMSVEEGSPMSHKDYGWDQFTDFVIELINQKKENVVFILWGSPAHKKAKNVDIKKHFVIKSVHPSPLSSYRGFFGSKPFSKTNDYLISKNISAIDWSIPLKSKT